MQTLAARGTAPATWDSRRCVPREVRERRDRETEREALRERKSGFGWG